MPPALVNPLVPRAHLHDDRQADFSKIKLFHWNPMIKLLIIFNLGTNGLTH